MMSYRWGQVFILDAVANYIPKDEREAQSICERITPRLAHANSAVVLSSVKVWIDLQCIGYTVFLSSVRFLLHLYFAILAFIMKFVL